MMKRLFTFVICLFLALAIVPGSVAEAKAKPKLSATKKTMYVGNTYKIKLKNASSKVKWKTSKKSVVSISKKKGKTITLKAKKPGKATITATYKGKKYKCKVTVKKKTAPDNPMLNATDVTLYYTSPNYEAYITQDASHLSEFQFKVTGTEAEVDDWDLISEDTYYFTLTGNGLIKVKAGPVYGEDGKSVTVRATLSNGKTLDATVRVYSESNIHIKKKFESFKQTYITDNMTEKEKVEKIAWYIGAISDYEAGNYDWESIFIKGNGDCMASRYAVHYMCEYLGIKSAPCGNVNYHGKTLVVADGVIYMVTTGFDEPRPRDYMIGEVASDKLEQICEDNWLNIDYFR